MARRVAEPTYRRYIVKEPERYDEADMVYSRVDRGEVIPPELIPPGENSGSPVHRIFSYDPDRKPRNGFSQADYALRWAGRTVDYLIRQNLYAREMSPTLPPMEVQDRGAVAERIKDVARWFGADVVGITELNRQWVYSRLGDHSHKLGLSGEVGDPIELPEYYRYAVVIACGMDYEQVKRSPAMEGATDLGYSRMAFTAVSVAKYIQELGYHAFPNGNDTALSIPLAVDAGLGEMGRNGLLITERYGPRVRLSKVFTDLPLAVDQPIDLGVQHFCETCAKCAKRCPAQALSKGERTADANNISNNPGMLKWPIDAERCIGWWLRNRAHCTVCIRTCAFNKPDVSWHRAAAKVVGSTRLLDKALVRLDDALGYGGQKLSWKLTPGGPESAPTPTPTSSASAPGGASAESLSVGTRP
jgi:epoxyqueuosine reductase